MKRISRAAEAERGVRGDSALVFYSDDDLYDLDDFELRSGGFPVETAPDRAKDGNYVVKGVGNIVKDLNQG